MKQLTYRLNALIATVVFTFLQLTTFAQESSGTSGTSTTTSSTKVEVTTDSGMGWFGDNWIWVVGGILFLVLLIALLGGGSRSTSRTTVVRDDTAGGTRVTKTTVDEV